MKVWIRYDVSLGCLEQYRFASLVISEEREWGLSTDVTTDI
jgi:hypothetical protein